VNDPTILARWVSDTLRAGTLLAAAVIIAGVITHLTTVTWIGLLLLTLTPVAQVGAAAAAFLRQRETRYALTALLALCLLLGALALALLLAPASGG